MPRPGVFTTDAVNMTQILFNVEHQLSLSVRVSDSGVPANPDDCNRKIIKAGTPLYGDVNNRDVDFTTTGGGTVAGLLLHDLDVTHGTNNSACLIFGFVNLNRLHVDVQALITPAVSAALPMVQFLRG